MQSCFNISLVRFGLVIVGVSHCLLGRDLFTAGETKGSKLCNVLLMCRVSREKGNLQLQMLQKRRPKQAMMSNPLIGGWRFSINLECG